MRNNNHCEDINNLIVFYSIGATEPTGPQELVRAILTIKKISS